MEIQKKICNKLCRIIMYAFHSHNKLPLFCFAAQQRCCQYYQYIHGQHFSGADAATSAPKLAHINSLSPIPRYEASQPYVLALVSMICHAQRINSSRIMATRCN